MSFTSDDGRTNVSESEGKEASPGDSIGECVLHTSLISVTYLFEIIFTRGSEEVLQSQFLMFQISKKARKVLFES